MAADKKLKVFVSYSRADSAFADELVQALEWMGYGVTIDRASIVEGEDWRRRLGALIADADTVVFLLSTHSARSEICGWEVEEAARLSKRLIPVLMSPTGQATVPERLAALNYVRFDPLDDGRPRSFVSALRGLERALDTDIEWLREHTRLAARAAEWDLAGRTENRLLRGADIEAARRWAAERPKEAPAPTELHLAFMLASEEAERRRTDQERVRLNDMATAQVARAQALDEREVAVKTVARRTLLGIAGTSVFALGAGGAGYVAFHAERRSLAARSKAESAQQALADKQRELARLRDLTRDEQAWRSADVPSSAVETLRSPPAAMPAAAAQASWAVKRVGADAQPHTGAGVTVAFIGSGVDPRHPAFAGLELVRKDFTGEGNGDDPFGHGTMMASILCGRSHQGRRVGVAPGVSRLVVIKFISDTGTGRMETLPVALDWALAFEGGSVDIVCLGFGQSTVRELQQELRAGDGGRATASRTLVRFAQTYRTTEGIINAAAVSGKGALIFSAAGNDSGSGVELHVNSPTAMARGVISVGALEERGGTLAVADYSNVGATLTAPGHQVPAAKVGGGFSDVSGTSVSCAVAAGTAALWWEMLRTQAPAQAAVSADAVWARMKAAARADVFAPEVQAHQRGLGLVQAPTG
ncbi:TIR domain-containing protein [Aquincola sp. S2]|uniref:TIR domain-containing protein n=1 Tax=Pseudaquabacterium terrae TaxID=2732868 RepID=A0ABX2EGN9_9BURK|nr:TIR domain-containing protein [Aquabacterium terrae]NRF67764.1 TIR domain-containing protein [Aquabacterium terrae]